MSVTSGFFNSLNHDRRYNAQQMSAIFDGIINDGVFANIGVAFAISVDTGVTINIGKGKAWFNSAWVYNDAPLPKTLEGSEVVLDRIDAVVIEVDHTESVRMGDIKIVKGTPSSSPKRPTMVNNTNKKQAPIAYIYRKAGSTSINQADITNMVGTSECPYITGILQVQNIDNVVAQWNAQWNQWYAEKVSETNSEASELLSEMKSEFDIWFADVQALLEDDVATALAAQVAELQSKFDDLAREGAIYDTIEDSSADVLIGSDGTPIKGRIIIGTPSAGSSGSTNYSPERFVRTETLTDSEWTGEDAPYTQTIYINGITANDTPHIGLVMSDDIDVAMAQMEAWSTVCKAITIGGGIVFTCFEDKPEVSLTVQIEVIR